MKLLIIEDNRSLAESLKKQLSKSYIVEVYRTGEDGLAHAVTGAYDIIILDLGLPDKHGYEVCKQIRIARVHTPVLILSAVSDVPSRVALLNIGADDYLTKPFSMAELKARIGALMRRVPEGYNENVLTASDLVIDPERRRVERGGVRIALRRKEFDILEYLVRNQGRPVTRSMILDHAWDGSKDAWNNTVDVHIKHLRDKVDRPFESALIKTAYGIGYMIDSV